MPQINRTVYSGRTWLMMVGLVTVLAVSQSASTNTRNLVPYSGVKSTLRRYRYPIYTKRELDLVGDIGTNCDRVQTRKRFLGGSRLGTLTPERQSLRQPLMVPDLDDLTHVLRLYKSGKRSEISPEQTGSPLNGPWLLDLVPEGAERTEQISGSWNDRSSYENPPASFSTSWQQSKHRATEEKRSAEDPYLVWLAAHMAEVGKRAQTENESDSDTAPALMESDLPFKRQARAFDDVFGWDKRKKKSVGQIQTDRYLKSIRKALGGSEFPDKEQAIKKSQIKTMK